MAECRSCQAAVVWVRTARQGDGGGKAMPLDAGRGSDGVVRPRAYPDGNIELTGKFVPGRFGKVAEVRYTEPGPGRYKSHFATCDAPEKFRKR